MTRSGWVAVAVLVLALAAMSALYAQARAGGGEVQMAQAPGGWERPGQMSEAERAKMRERMIERMLEQAGLTSKEKAAARATIKAKGEAREALGAALTKLRRTANKEKPSEKELREALAGYRTAMAQYRKKVEGADAALAKHLTLKGQVRCTSLGIMENGLGGFGRMGGEGGTGRPGGSGGGRPG